MSSDDVAPRSTREQTDESLRVERQKADEAMDDESTSIEETADNVIRRARERADAVLAATRANTDRKLPSPSVSPASVKNERLVEDRVLVDERATADEVLRTERAQHIELLSRERGNTDKDLSNERARSDEALATRDEFLAIVSHDLRNLLNAMIGSAEMIAAGVLSDGHVDRVRTQARRIQRSGARMSRLIGDLVDVASIEAGRLAVAPEVGDPADVVGEAVETFQAQAAAAGIALGMKVPSPPSLAVFDTARILQVLTNLLSNALKFTPPGGTVLVRVDRADDGVRVAVSDTGVGIPADRLDAVFVRFLQIDGNDRRGQGLGLYISKAIVNGHGGRIWAESHVDEGTTFFFTLPAHLGP